jgi:3-phosphoshikimate 1-carboxyvinyltransferase
VPGPKAVFGPGSFNVFKEMGADITILNQRQDGEECFADLQVNYSSLKGIDIPSSMVPLAIDEFPIIFIAAACAYGETTLKGARELRLKESDRIGAMVEGLTQLGIEAQGFDDGISIKGGALHGGIVDSRGDHRIAMSFSIAGAVSSGPVTIKNCANVATSVPTFVTTANKLHFQIEELIDNA